MAKNAKRNPAKRKKRPVKAASKNSSGRLVSARRKKLSLLGDFFVETRKENRQCKYMHLLLAERSGNNQPALDELRDYARTAHEGARLRLRAPLGDSLDPLDFDTERDPAFGYPEVFDLSVLKGFLGELFAGIAAEQYEIFDSNEWEVPVFLFRTHTAAFQQLERISQDASRNGAIVGRTGDDGLAFERDEDGFITRWMACEAKCTSGHSASMHTNNHEQLSSTAYRPIDLLRMIEALGDYEQDDYAKGWIAALTALYWRTGERPGSVERCDSSVYVCGQRPILKASWIDSSKPPPKYKGMRRLAAIEIHLDEVDSKVKYIYSKEDKQW